MIGEYVTHPHTATIHIVAQDEAMRRQARGWLPLTLCGYNVTDDWTSGDETTSGHSATCKVCRRAMRGHS